MAPCTQEADSGTLKVVRGGACNHGAPRVLLWECVSGSASTAAQGSPAGEGGAAQGASRRGRLPPQYTSRRPATLQLMHCTCTPASHPQSHSHKYGRSLPALLGWAVNGTGAPAGLHCIGSRVTTSRMGKAWLREVAQAPPGVHLWSRMLAMEGRASVGQGLGLGLLASPKQGVPCLCLMKGIET